MNLVSNFDPALTRICVLDYYPFEQRIPLFFESDLDKIKNDQNKTVITTYNFTGYPILKPHIEDFLIYRLKNNLQTVSAILPSFWSFFRFLHTLSLYWIVRDFSKLFLPSES